MKVTILILIAVSVQLFAFDIGLGIFKTEYSVSVKEMPLHSKKGALSSKNSILKYGDIVILTEDESSTEDTNTTSKWVYVSLENNESIKGYAHRSALMDNAIYNQLLQGTSSLLGSADEGLNLVVKDSGENKKKEKGFSEEEKVDRKVKKGFSNSEDSNSTVSQTPKIIAIKIQKVQETLDTTEVSDTKVIKFIKDGELK